MNAIGRQQAEQVVLAGFPVRGRTGECQVTNESDRPVRLVTCRMLHAGNLTAPAGFRIGEELRPVPGTPEPGRGFLRYLPAGEGTFESGTGSFHQLPAGQVIRAVFPVDDGDSGTAQYIIQFSDDDEVRWRLDSDMQLSPPPDSSW